MPSDFFEYVYDDAGKLIEIIKQDSIVIPPDPPPPTDPSSPDEWINFKPQWRVGASGGLFADPGTGDLSGWYKRAVVRLNIDGTMFDRFEVELFIELSAINPLIPDGEGFEFILPDIITPAIPRGARGGGGDLWIEGGENSYSIAAKWTDRNNRPMRLIILLDGREWTTNVPKVIPLRENKATATCYFWMKYLK